LRRLLQFQDPRPVPNLWEFIANRKGHFVKLWGYTSRHLPVIFQSTLLIFVLQFFNVINSRVRTVTIQHLTLLQVQKDFIDWALPTQSYPLVAFFSILMVFIPLVRIVL
jgi:hypothetical protein